MNMPGFDAESSLRPAIGKYRAAAGYGRPGSGGADSAIVAQALGGLAAIRNGGVLADPSPDGVVLPFKCNQNRCTCNGFGDCLDLAFSGLCADFSCTKDLNGNDLCGCKRA